MITINFDTKALVAQAKATQQQIHQQVEQLLGYAGRVAVSRQREIQAPQSYMDQSGNLRSSVGFVVMAGGQEVASGGFEPKQGPNPQPDAISPAEAVEVGKKEARAEAARMPSFPTLTVVAGMNYASYVQDKGRDVLSTARIVAEDIVRKGLEDLAR